MSEQTLAFGPGDRLVGTFNVPQTFNRDIGLIMLNSGVVHRVGPHRINVRLARRLAAKGIASLRFDLSGQGDSDRSSDSLDYRQQAVADISLAIDKFSSLTGLKRFAVFGFCSGAHHGFAAALVEQRIAGLMIYDAFLYETFKSRVNYFRERLRHYGLAGAIFKAATRAQRGVKSVFLGKTGGTPEIAGNNETVFARNPEPSEFAAGLGKLLDRGVRVSIINSGAFAMYNYAEQFHDTFAPFGISDRIPSAFLPDLNHAATLLSHQRDLMGHVESWVTDWPAVQERPAA